LIVGRRYRRRDETEGQDADIDDEQADPPEPHRDVLP
jgi:hypothetical protein